jgi:hypothetical protein
MKIKQNFLRVLLSDSTAVEMAAGFYAFSQLPKAWGLPQDRWNAGIVAALGLIRIYAVLVGRLRLRLIVAYAATFAWLYFVLFTWLEAPTEYVTGGVASAVINIWIAWRLQTLQHMHTKVDTFKREGMV